MKRAPLLPPPDRIEREDLVLLAWLLPDAVNNLVRVAGIDAALALLVRWPGVQYPVPKYKDSNAAGTQRWDELAAIVGEAAMAAIAGYYGGSELVIPTCQRLLAHKRHRWMRERYDDLTDPHGPALSGHDAVRELGLALAEAGIPTGHRQIEIALNRAEAAAPAPSSATARADQRDLFDPSAPQG